jgi:polysaccharide pyruvyl transferase CsaB
MLVPFPTVKELHVRVLLSAFIGSKNLGDEAIFAVVSALVPEKLGADLTVLSIDLEKTRAHPLAAGTEVEQASVRNFVRLARKSDAVLMGGGGIIQDESSVINLLYYYLQSWVANALLKKPVYLVYVGVGPVTSGLGHWLLRRMSRRVARSLVRDRESADLLTSHGFDESTITVAFDIVYNLVVPAPATTASDYIVFAPRDWFFTQRYLPTRYALTRSKKDAASGLNRFRTRLLTLVSAALTRHPELRVVGIPFFLSQDNDLLAWIKARLTPEQSSRFDIRSEYISPEEYVAIAAGSRAILGMRLHSLVLGTLSGRPLVPLIYSAKVRSMIAYLGLAERATELTKPDFDYEATLSRLDQALGSPDPIDAAALKHIQDTNLTLSDRFFAEVRADLAGTTR